MSASPKQSAITSQDKAVYDLKVQRDRLRKFQVKNDAIVTRETAIARELLRKGQKERARLVLRKKKYHENLIQQTYGKLANLEELVGCINTVLRCIARIDLSRTVVLNMCRHEND